MERNCVRFLDNFSAGTRGAISAEYFLEAGYAVIFLHREYSLRPYSRLYTHSKDSVFDLLEINNNNVNGNLILVNQKHTTSTLNILLKYQKTKEMILFLEYVTVTEYLDLLQRVALALKDCKKSALMYLAAAVSDFYIPLEEMVQTC